MDKTFPTWFLTESIFQASEALYMVSFQIFVKSMTSCLSYFKITPSFCFPNTISDNVTAPNTYYRYVFILHLPNLLFLDDLLTLLLLHELLLLENLLLFLLNLLWLSFSMRISLIFYWLQGYIYIRCALILPYST